VTRLIAYMFEQARKLVGVTSTEGVYIDGVRIMAGDCSGPQSAQAVLLHPRVEVAVLETARGGILRAGLAFDACTVGVVTNISADHMGLGGVETLEDLARVKQVVVEAARRDGAAVLNADDALVAEMAAATDAPVIYFSVRADNHVVAAHLAAGGRAVLVENGAVVLAQDRQRTELIELERVAFSAGGRIGFQVQNALAATAAAWGAGLNPALIARALATFASDTRMVPGRFNRWEAGGIEVVMDYGHNQAAMAALGAAVVGLGQRRTVLVLGLPGDRRDADLRATVEATRAFADAYVLYDLADRRGRAPMELPQMMCEQIGAGRMCVMARDQHKAIQAGWRMVGSGDRLVVIVDEVDAAIAQMTALAESTASDGACVAVPLRERSVGV
jgi:cyanophycin synthetase